jgi:hypothetical protein
MSDEQSGQRERAGETAPRVWVLLGQKPGDNAQVANLVRAVGWPAVEKRIVVLPRWEQGKPRIRPSLAHVDLARSDALEAPWPDLVFASGRRLACVALWIKRASQGRTRIVMIGMPRHRRGAFDLLVVASHYVTKAAPNVAAHDLPLMHVDRGRIDAAVAAWSSRLSGLARPITVLMIGGPTGGHRFDAAAARDLLARAKADVARVGGSLYVTTSRRTPADVVAMLEREGSAGIRLHVFDANAPPAENPYLALLGLADHFIVTTDSLSMMVEVVDVGKSLALVPLASDAGVFERALERLGLVRPLDPRRDPIPAGGFLVRSLHRLGLPIHTRDLSAIPRRLVERGLASWLGDPRVRPEPGAGDELERIVQRVRRLGPRAPEGL